ncbi:MAG: cyclic nucleotide-binding domain-containing protein [Actinomycetota bacterium]
MANRGLVVLERVRLFEGLSKRQLKKIYDAAGEVRYMEGVSIVKQGEPGDAFYVILEGQAKVTKGGRTINRLVPGEYFGEISLLDGGKRSASVMSETPMVMVEVKQRAFHKLIREDPTVARRLMESLARRLRAIERSLHD